MGIGFSFKGNRLRAFVLVVWSLCWVFAVALLGINIETIPNLTGMMHPSFLVLSYGMSIAFLATHFLVFSGKADKSDLSRLALYFTFFTLTILPIVPNPAQWIQFFAISIIVLGLEYALPDWPVRVYKTLIGLFQKGDGLTRF